MSLTDTAAQHALRKPMTETDKMRHPLVAVKCIWKEPPELQEYDYPSAQV